VSAVHADIRWLTDVRREHRSWLAYSEIDLLNDFELQAWSGWSLSTHQRAVVERMARSALDRRDMAIELSRRIESDGRPQGGRQHDGQPRDNHPQAGKVPAH
jgi:hypothetical protein